METVRARTARSYKLHAHREYRVNHSVNILVGVFIFAEGEKMKKIIDTPETPEIFENDIDFYFNEFCKIENIEDMKKEPQPTFYAALMYVCKHCFKGTDRLRLKNAFPNYHNNNYNNQYSNLNNSNCNAYNYIYLDSIADYYIYICNKYNKICTISGYSKLTGISESVISSWGNKRLQADRLSTSAICLYEKLIGEYESSGESRLWSNKNPVGQLAVMNRRFGWNLPGVSRETSSRQALTAVDIRQMLTSDRNNPAIETTAADVDTSNDA